ncbi:MAG TPA: LexA family transcriptional regulator, partial [Pirellulales bacterium]
CPPEDVGGMWGYADFLDAIRDPSHENHKDMLTWVGRRFDPEKFSATAATKEMRRGLPDWRDYA